MRKSMMLRRSGWGLADQAVSSLGNTLMMLLVARATEVADFGAFSLAFSAYMLMVGVSRSVISDPLTVRHAASPSGKPLEEAIRAAIGVGCIFGVIGAVIIGLAGGFFGGRSGATLVSLAWVLPGLLVQDVWRLAFFTSARPGRAALNDTLWVILQLVSIALLMVRGRPSGGELILVWGIAGNVAALFGCFQARLKPRLASPRLWLNKHKDLIPSFAIENLAGSGAQQGLVYAVAAIAGLPAVAALRAAEVLLGPLNTLYATARIVLLPEAVRMAQKRRALLRTMVKLSLVLGMFSIAWGIALFRLPDGIGEDLLGENWHAGMSVLLPSTATKVLAATSAGAIIGMRALARARRSASVRVLIGVSTIVAGSVGAWQSGAFGASSATAMVGFCAMFVWWDQFLKASKSSHTTPSGTTPKRGHRP